MMILTPAEAFALAHKLNTAAAAAEAHPEGIETFEVRVFEQDIGRTVDAEFGVAVDDGTRDDDDDDADDADGGTCNQCGGPEGPRGCASCFDDDGQ